jgi:hypothetical protein
LPVEKPSGLITATVGRKQLMSKLKNGDADRQKDRQKDRLKVRQKEI